MSRVLGVARFELKRLQRMLVWLVGLLLLMGALALYSGAQHVKHQSRNAMLLQLEQQDYLDKQSQKIQKRVDALAAEHKPLSPDRKSYRNPVTLAQHGMPAVLGNGPLMLVSVGLTPLQPQSMQVTLADPALLEAKENLQHPLQLWTGHFDLAFVLVYLLPLLLIALSFDLTAGEQQSGNLKMLLVQGGGLEALIQGKLLARFAVLTGMIALLTLMAWSAHGLMALPFAWGRWALMMLWTFLYGSVWLGLAAVLNALRWQAATIAATLASLWLLGVWVIPGSGQQVLQALYPVPSRIAYVQSYREASEKVRMESSRLLGKYLEDHPDLAGGTDNRYAMLQLSKEQALGEAIRPVVGAYQARLGQQQRLARWLRYFSPVTVYENSLMQLAGSGEERQRHYRGQVEAFQTNWKNHFLPLIRQDQALLPAHIKQLPGFSHQELSLRALARALWAQGLFLAFLALGLMVWSLRRYRRYEIIESEPG